MSENDESVVKIPEVEYWLCIVDDEAAIRDGLVRNYNSVLGESYIFSYQKSKRSLLEFW